jgi:hypothetical protein
MELMTFAFKLGLIFIRRAMARPQVRYYPRLLMFPQWAVRPIPLPLLREKLQKCIE